MSDLIVGIIMIIITLVLVYRHTRYAFDNEAEAIALLNQLNEFVVIPVQKEFGPTFPQLKDVVLKESPYRSNDSSYTINKQYIYMCLRRPENMNTFYDLSTLSHVLLHELAHVMSDTYGHTSDFNRAFHDLKEFRLKRLSPSIHSPPVGSPYCGVVL